MLSFVRDRDPLMAKDLMTNPPNPIMQGLSTALRDPLLFMLEILWRWCFALLAFLLIFAAGAILLGPLPIANRWASTWNSHNPQLIGTFIFAVVSFLGYKLIVAAILVPFLIAILWGILSTLGRSITVKRLRAGVTSLRFRSLMAIQFLRALMTWTSFVLLSAALVGETLIATRSSKPDLALYYLMVMPTVVIFIVIWLVLNWYLSLAAIFGRDGQTFRGAFRQARQTVAKQRADFAGTGFVFLLMRAVLLLVALAICGLASRSAGTSPQGYFTLLMVVAVAYFAIADFLYMARMASYLALAAAHVEPGGPKLVVSSSTLPVESSSAH
jgi:hypothetical protein